MIRPLALPGEGPHFAWVKIVLALFAALLLSTPVLAQVEESEPSEDDGSSITIEPRAPRVVPIDPIPAPDLPPDVSDLPPPDESVPEAPVPEAEAPDYSRLSSSEERAARLDEMFDRLGQAEEAAAGQLVAEEIWAVWMNSGSASVDLILRRAARAQARGDNRLARRLYDHVTRLQPDHAEGWARSSRLALEEADFTRAASEAVTALTLEPRHFYALWTLGNVLERLGRTEDAMEAYGEANALYPSLESVSERIDALEIQLGGSVL
ncbi:MAG: hypothetical protein WBF53_02660 [Litorimonas sp.]